MYKYLFEVINWSIINEIKSSLYINSSICFLSKIVEKVKPIKVYTNLKENRNNLMKDQKGKTGVYCLVNKLNGHFYIGSSVNLSVRMRNYLNNTFLLNTKNKNMPIIKSLLKYSQDNFAVLILEYTDKDNLAIRETNYITNLMPYYNVLKKGYS